MPPLIFRLVPLLIAVFALAMAAFPRQMTTWRMRGPGGDATIEPSRARLLMTRVMGLVVAAIAGAMALGGPRLLF